MLLGSRLGHWWSLGAIVLILFSAGAAALGATSLIWLPGMLVAWLAIGSWRDRLFLYSLVGVAQELWWKDDTKAAAWYRKAVEAGSTDAHVQARLGHHSLVEGDYVEAARLLESALGRIPDHVHARLDLALAWLRLGRWVEARAEVDRAVISHPGYPLTWVVRGMVQKQGGDLDGAYASTTRALDLEPDMALAHSNLGEILYASKCPQKAKRHLQQAVTLAPDIPDAYYWLALVHLDEGNTSQARLRLVECLNRLIPLDCLSNVTRQLVLKELALISP